MGSKPFRPLGFRLLSQAAVNRLTMLCLRHPEHVLDHISTAGQRDGLSFVRSAVLERAVPVELARLRARCPLPFTPHLFIFKPGNGIAPHRDGRVGVRQCAIIEPLHPLQGYAPTLFWQDEQVTHTLERAALPALVDLQTVHSVPASGAMRINFQLALHVPYAVAAERLASGAFEPLRPAA